eukprot:TRINITY_DN3439_c0_g1_i2.p1 TRINITY_DN3439_c0_g1~~TRINITY_DN3439_c0_g1_i2.p1  ORF type:complete len:357 (+),score=48.23 TRINITY_DN3439_c0_g1_i2:68-1138(+)
MSFRLEVRHDETHFGDVLAVVGSGTNLGEWNPAHAKHLQTNAELFPAWSIELPLSVLTHEFKVIVLGNQGEVTWEQISNRRWNLSVADISPGASVVHTIFNDEKLMLRQTQSEYTRPSRCRFADATSVFHIPKTSEVVGDITKLFYDMADYWGFRSEHPDVFAPQTLLHLKDYCNRVVIEQARQRDLRISDDDALSRVAQDFSRRDADSAIKRAISLESEQSDDLCLESSHAISSEGAPSGEAAAKNEEVDFPSESSSASSSGSREAATKSEQVDFPSESSSASSSGSREAATKSEEVDFPSESSSASSSKWAPAQVDSAISCEQSRSGVGSASWVSFCFPFLLPRRQAEAKRHQP